MKHDGVQILLIAADGSTQDITEEEFLHGCARDMARDERLASVKKDATVPAVGDTVRFNDHGLEQCFGSALGKQAMKRHLMKVTYVGAESMTYPEPTFDVEVDDPEINMFLLDNACFDIVARA